MSKYSIYLIKNILRRKLLTLVILVILGLLMVFFYSNKFQNCSSKSSANLIKDPAFQELLSITGADSYKLTRKQLIEKLKNEGWLGKNTVERWELKLPPKVAGKEEEIIRILHEELNIDKAVEPKDMQYKAILLLGTTLARVESRVQYLLDLYEKGLSKDIPIYVLTGERKLSKSAGETIEAFENFKKRYKYNYSGRLPSNEVEMIKFVLGAILSKNIKVIYVESIKDPAHIRATTSSTLVTFLKDYKLEKGKYLAISNQPYITYQQSVLDLVLATQKREDITIDVAGPGIKKSDIKDKNNYAAILLRTIVQILENQNKIEELH